VAAEPAEVVSKVTRLPDVPDRLNVPLTVTVLPDVILIVTGWLVWVRSLTVQLLVIDIVPDAPEKFRLPQVLPFPPLNDGVVPVKLTVEPEALTVKVPEVSNKTLVEALMVALARFSVMFEFEAS
jgi:hypothetical protein